MIQRIAVAGGGTGGHLFPGIAIVEELRRRNPDLEALFIGTKGGLEARLLPARGERVEFIDATPLVGRTASERVRSLGLLPLAVVKAASILRGFHPQLVLGLGGYASAPVVLAAASSGIGTALHEQNARVGLANRMLAPIVSRAYLTYERTVAPFGERRARVLGNPVRRSFVEAARLALADPLGLEARGRRILVFGGSQGAQALDRIVPEAMHAAELGRWGVSVLHQAGAATRDEVAARYRNLGVDAQVVPFIDDMARAFTAAPLVISRAGATTLAELCAVGRPAILIPLPQGREQVDNARALADAGAAIHVPQSQLEPRALGQQIASLLANPDKRREIADAARRLGRPDAAAAIVDDLCAHFGPAHRPREGGDGSACSAPDAPESDREQRDGERRRPKVRRAQLRVYAADGVAESLDAAGARAGVAE